MGLAIADLEGKYEIVAKLKEGGMGAIYKVRHRLLDELRVIKVLRPQHEGDEELRLRLAREARSAIQLRHPNVVQIFDFSLDDSGGGLIVMEYIHGADLSYLLEESRRPSLALALEIARQSLRALGFLHRQGFVHRDVSPDNLMLGVDVEGEPLVKLIDLGIAKNHEAEQDLTISGSFLGKFRYASPEHFGAKGPDGTEARSDLYTFGLVLYELLTGCYPMEGDSTSQLIAAHLFQPPRDFDETDPEGRIPPEVRSMVLRALEKKSEDRFADARPWIRAIEKLQKDYPLTERELQEAARLGRPPEGWARPISGDTQWRFGKLFGAPGAPGDASSGVHRPPDAESAADESPSRPGSGISSTDAAALDVLLAGAEALAELARHDQAARQVETILSLDPSHEGALRLKERLEQGTETEPGTDAGFEPTVLLETGQPPEAPPVFAAGSAGGDGEPVSPSAVVRFDELMRSLHLVEADLLLRELEEKHGAELDPLPDMRQRLAERFQDRLAEKIQNLLQEARDLVDEGDYTVALERLREAQAQAPTTGPIHDELTLGVIELQRRIEARERRKKVAKVEQRVLRLLRSGELEQAGSELEAARAALGDGDVLDSLEKILGRSVLERQNELGGEAGRALETGRYDTAIRCLEDMLRLDPESAWIRGQLERAQGLKDEAEAEEARRREEEEERRTDFEQLAAMLSRSELQEARRMLDILAQRWGESTAAPWRERLQERCRADAAGLLAEAEQAREAGDLFKARLLVAEAGRLDPDDSTVTLFACMLDSAAREKVEGDPVPLHDHSGVLHVIAEIERLRLEGLPLQAWKALQQAVEHFGERSELLHLRKELAEQILEESGGAL